MSDLANPALPGEAERRSAPRALRLAPAAIVTCALAVLAVHAWAILGRPLYVTAMAHDVFIFIDAAQRVQSGLRPHLDFHSGLGALAFYGPGLWGLLDDPFRSFALFYVLALALALALGVYAALSRRLDAFAGIALVVYLGAAVGAPSNLGDLPSNLSFAMWYNRLGWGLILVGALLFLPPSRRGAASALADAAVIFLLGTVCFFLKVSIAAAAGALFAFGFLAFAHLRRPALLAAAATLALLATVELATGGMIRAYLADVRFVGAVNGSDLVSPLRLLPTSWNIAWEIALTLLAGLVYALAARGVGWRWGLFFVLLVLLSDYLFSTNVQTRGVVALLAVPLGGYALLRRGERPRAAGPRRLAAPLLAVIAVAFAAPETIGRYTSLALYVAASREAAYPFAAPPRLANGLVAGDTDPAATPRFMQRLVAGEPAGPVLAERAAFVAEHTPAQSYFLVEYAYILAQGAAALEQVARADGRGPGPVLVLDFSNPLSPILDWPPPRGDFAWFHIGRDINAAHHPAAADLFAGARYVMAAKYTPNDVTRDLLLDLYAPFIAANYRLVADGPLWRIWSRLPEAGPAAAAAG